MCLEVLWADHPLTELISDQTKKLTVDQDYERSNQLPDTVFLVSMVWPYFGVLPLGDTQIQGLEFQPK